MSRSDVSENSEALRNAEKRAENAERHAQQLDKRLEALENSRQPQSSTESKSRFVDPSESQRTSSDDDALAALRNEPMMDHLLNALDSRQDIGHYGRLVFAMVAHHFLSEHDMLHWLTKDPGTNPEEAVALLPPGGRSRLQSASP